MTLSKLKAGMLIDPTEFKIIAVWTCDAYVNIRLVDGETIQVYMPTWGKVDELIEEIYELSIMQVKA